MTATVGSGISIAETEKNTHVQNQAISQLIQGRSNALVLVTLTVDAPTTTVSAPNCGAGSAPIPVPMTASAAAEIGNGTMYISTVSNGSFVITHDWSLVADRTFRFVTLG